jgi:DNA primase
MIPPEIIEQIRDAADLVQLIGEHVELKRTGSDWRGPCPFHGGTHRNFSVVPRKQMYHCFVCHESGDVFTFFMKKFGLDYPGAVKEIAGRVGVAVPESQKTGPDPNEPLYSALGVAAEWFARRLREDPEARIARDTLARRGLSDEVRDEFGLGYAPPGRETFLDAMRTMGLSDDVLIEAGLALRREDGSVGARFWGRLLFPIADVRGRVVGFGGRILGEGEPKYLNSPESAVFHKGTLLYLLDRARGPIRNEGFAIVVEGYVDAIRLHAAGIACAVAPLGTALTPEQSKVLRRYTRQVVLAYDADAPGLKSTFRAGDEMLRHGATVQVITMPPGEDPDTLVLKGGEQAFRELLAQAVDLFELKVKLLDRKNLFTGIKERRRALDRLLPTIRAAADPVTRAQYIALASERTGVKREVIEQEALKGEARYAGGPREAPPADDVPRGAPVRLAQLPEIPQERDLLRLMRSDAAWLERGRREIRLDQLRHRHYREIAAALFQGSGAPPAEELVPLWEELGRPLDPGFDAEAEFTAAAEWIRDRPRQERLAEIDRLMPLADAEEQQKLYQEKVDLRSSGEVRFRRKALKAEREPL